MHPDLGHAWLVPSFLDTVAEYDQDQLLVLNVVSGLLLPGSWIRDPCLIGCALRFTGSFFTRLVHVREFNASLGTSIYLRRVSWEASDTVST